MAAQSSMSLRKEAAPGSAAMGRERFSSMVHRTMLTLSAGRRVFGAEREYWYARVEMVLSGNSVATRLTKASRDPAGVPSRSSMARHRSHSQYPCVSFWLTDQ